MVAEHVKPSGPKEREADVLGMQYMYMAGYDPTAFVDLARLATLENRRRVDRPDSNSPTLRRAPGNGPADEGNGVKPGTIAMNCRR